jgi:phage shock protein PspC (stress-responsive transcriptional regulator)
MKQNCYYIENKGLEIVEKIYTFANMKNWKYLVEPRLFGVCTQLAERFHLPLSLVRLFFIYISFVGLLSPVLFYLSFAFFLRFKEQFFQKKYQSIREL